MAVSVNEFMLLADFKIPVLSGWHTIGAEFTHYAKGTSNNDDVHVERVYPDRIAFGGELHFRWNHEVRDQ